MINERISLILIRLRNGILKTIRKPYIYPYAYIFFGLSLYIINKLPKVAENDGFIILFFKYSILISLLIIMSITLFLIIIKVGTPFRCKSIHNKLYRIGLTNHIGSTPILIDKCNIQNKKYISIYTFMNNGISLEEFDNKKNKIESSLNISILEIKYGDTKNRILIFAHSSKHKYSNTLTWDNSYLTDDDFTIVLGESLLEQVSIDLSRTPHMLIGGSSGSGKSILLKLILMQSIQKKAKIYIADFKGGVDFSKVWHEKCSLVLNESNLLITLDIIVSELENRKNMFFLNEVSNIKDYNAIGNDLPRIIFACDEIAEVLDKTGLNKEQKEIVSKIESLISIIARQGRALGIHLILSTQRPDANILSGQIKSNINYRICGRADSILSSIILDNSNASKYIPCDSQGRFINQNDMVFQSYWFDENNI